MSEPEEKRPLPTEEQIFEVRSRIHAACLGVIVRWAEGSYPAEREDAATAAGILDTLKRVYG